MSPFEILALPNGTVIPNRIAKAAMEENMADDAHAPSAALIQLYRAWADGGAGLILTGNVMIDRRAMTGPGGVVLEDISQLEAFRKWARTARAKGAQVLDATQSSRPADEEGPRPGNLGAVRGAA